MRTLYEFTGGDESEPCNADSVLTTADVARDDRALLDFLEGEGLIRTRRNAGGNAYLIQITHPGVVEVEQALASPNEPTQHFAPINSITIMGNVSGGQIGIASGDLTQTAMYNGSQSDSVKAWLEEYRAALPGLDDGLRLVAKQQLDQAMAEIDKPDAHPGLIGGLLTSLKSFAQSSIAAAGAGAGTMVLTELVANWPL